MARSSRMPAAAKAELQKFILGKLQSLRRSSVVSANALIDDIRSAHPSCTLADEHLAKLISEAAMLLGLVPVFDPRRAPDGHATPGDAFGYGHPAHRPDPAAAYSFQPGPSRMLPIRNVECQLKDIAPAPQ